MLMSLLFWSTPVGLMMDIIGFLLVVRYGHSLFIHMRTVTPNDGEGKDGDVFLVFGSDWDDRDSQRRERTRKNWARWGVGIIVLGFILQIVGFIAAVYG